MNRLSTLPCDILLMIEDLAKRGKLRTTKPRKRRTNFINLYPASIHDLRNLPLTEREYEEVLNKCDQSLPGAQDTGGIIPLRIMEVFDNVGYDPYHRRTLVNHLKKHGFKRNGKVLVRRDYSLAPTSRRFRDLPRPRSSSPKSKSKRARPASP